MRLKSEMPGKVVTKSAASSITVPRSIGGIEDATSQFMSSELSSTEKVETTYTQS